MKQWNVEKSDTNSPFLLVIDENGYTVCEMVDDVDKKNLPLIINAPRMFNVLYEIRELSLKGKVSMEAHNICNKIRKISDQIITEIEDGKYGKV